MLGICACTFGTSIIFCRLFRELASNFEIDAKPDGSRRYRYKKGYSRNGIHVKTTSLAAAERRISEVKRDFVLLLHVKN